MCTRYVTPEEGDLERFWNRLPRDWHFPPIDIYPSYKAPFIRAARDSVAPQREIVLGQWNLIPWFAKEPKLKYATCNARSEELAAKSSYKLPWARGQRCIIPAQMFYEPNWETGKHIPWQFRRADGTPWSLAGIWNTWVNKSTGEIYESYSMLTLNADSHPIMSRMHRPDPKRPPHMQDKRSVIPIEFEDIDDWLFGTQEMATSLLRLPAVERLHAMPAAAHPAPPPNQGGEVLL